MEKKILIVAINKHWTGIARLPSGLSRAGFEVFAVCPVGSYLSKTKFLYKSIQYPTFSYSRSKLAYFVVLYSIIRFKPDFIIPGDEDALLALQNISNGLSKVPFFKKISQLIRNSLPAKEFDEMMFSKSRLLKNCEKWGVKAPKNFDVETINEAKKAANELGYPIVLKMDAGYGGTGVFICQSEIELVKNFNSNKRKSYLLEFKKFIKRTLFISIFNEQSGISVQEFMKGLSGQAPFVAFKGNVLATNSMLKIKTHPGSTGPSSVNEGFDNDLVTKFVEIVARKTTYTGFGSLDFIYDANSGNIHIIELNPRPTPVCHFSDQIVTNDLCSVLFKKQNNQRITLNSFKASIVAMFPNEKRRDPKSEFLQTAFHDIPVDDEELRIALDSPM